MKKALFPGSFDPFHTGHHSIYLKALELFEEVIIYVTVNHAKQHDHSLKQRVQLIETLIPDAKIMSGQKATVRVALEQGCQYLIRGVRNQTDLWYERDLASANKLLSSQIETILFFTDEALSEVSSSALKEVARLQTKWKKVTN